MINHQKPDTTALQLRRWKRQSSIWPLNPLTWCQLCMSTPTNPHGKGCLWPLLSSSTQTNQITAYLSTQVKFLIGSFDTIENYNHETRPLVLLYNCTQFDASTFPWPHVSTPPHTHIARPRGSVHILMHFLYALIKLHEMVSWGAPRSACVATLSTHLAQPWGSVPYPHTLPVCLH